MKKYSLLILVILSMVLLSACKHEHKFAEEWESNNISHWHKATCEHDTVKDSFEPHNWVEGDLTPSTCVSKGSQNFVCSVCGVTKTEEVPVIEHSYSETYESDLTHHWVKCSTCSEIIKEEHSGGVASFLEAAKCDSCGAFYGEKLVLNPTSNIEYENGLLTFDSVSLATGYNVCIKKNGNEVVNEKVTENKLDLQPYNLGGTYEVSVYTYSGDYTLETPAVSEITILSSVMDVVLEAEIGLQAYANMYKGNSFAHGGAYVGSIDNCGQGVTLNYFCYVSGAYELEAYYMTEVLGAYHNVYVNGSKQGRLNYTEITGWGNAEKVETAKTTLTISLQKGWNQIVVIKDGNENDNYGAWAELDYFVVKGTNQTYNIDDYADYNLNGPDSYRLEGEQASFIYREHLDDKIVWEFSNLVPFPDNLASSNYMIGDINNVGQGLEWFIKVNQAGKYHVNVVYAHEYAANTVKLSFYHSAYTLRGIALTNTELNEYKVGDLVFDEGSGWGVPLLNSQSIEIDLVEGDNFIYLTKELADVYCQIDYIELTFVE